MTGVSSVWLPPQRLEFFCRTSSAAASADARSLRLNDLTLRSYVRVCALAQVWRPKRWGLERFAPGLQLMIKQATLTTESAEGFALSAWMCYCLARGPIAEHA